VYLTTGKIEAEEESKEKTEIKSSLSQISAK
jgi:hypothetical protein